jgi:hypothetical protein
VAKEALTDAKASLLAGQDAAFAGLLALLDALPPLAESDSPWGPYEIVSHMSGWHTRAAERLRFIARGEPPPPPSETETPDQLNARYVAERRGRPAADILSELRHSFGDLRAAIESVPASEFWRGKGDEEDSLAFFIAYANGEGHYCEHLAELEAAK